MTREDWDKAAEIVSAEMFDDPSGVQESVWNMALKAASRALIREAVRTNAPWADPR